MNPQLTSQANNSHQNTILKGSLTGQVLGLLLNGHEFEPSQNH